MSNNFLPFRDGVTEIEAHRNPLQQKYASGMVQHITKRFLQHCGNTPTASLRHGLYALKMACVITVNLKDYEMKITAMDGQGTIYTCVFPDTYTKIESDGNGGLIQVVYNKSGQYVAGYIAGLVLKIEDDNNV